MVTTQNITAAELMKTKVITLHPNDLMQKVKDIFDTYSIRHIPIMVSDRIVGLISQSDFLRIEGLSRDSFDAFLKDKIMKLHTVEKYMTTEVICCTQSTPITKILDLFLENEVHSLLVVEDRQLLGIITPQDILRHLRMTLSDE